MVKRTIMIAMDGKPQAENAFHWYLEHMNKPGDHVVLFHCSQFQLNIGLPGRAVNVDHVTEQVTKARDRSESIMNKATDVLRSKEISGHYVLKNAPKPQDAILESAKEEEVDHIVMGTRDLGSVKRALVGSVSTEVVRHAHVPVTIVKYHG